MPVATIFDFLFIAAFFSAVRMIGIVVLAAIRGQRKRAGNMFTIAALFVALYFGVVIIVSLATPRRVLVADENKCWDEFCLGVTDIQRSESTHSITYVVTIRISNRARR